MAAKFTLPPPPKEPFPETLGANPTPTSRLGQDPILEPPLPKVKDAYGRMISTKKANQPFISYALFYKNNHSIHVELGMGNGKLLRLLKKKNVKSERIKSLVESLFRMRRGIWATRKPLLLLSAR